MEEKQLRTSMQHALDLLVTDISSIRTGRATPALVEGLEVSVYGGTQKMRIREIASISCPDPQLIQITPWDKSIIGEIRKGIMEANVGFNPAIDGEMLRIALPPLTGEDREKYVKLVSTKLENARVMIRQERSGAMHEIKKSFETKEVTEDEKKHQEKKVQDITDEFTKKVDQIGEAKKKELLQV
jgi:ribosome recycling factor